MQRTTIFPGMTVTSVCDSALVEVLALNQRSNAKHVRALYVRFGRTWLNIKLTRPLAGEASEPSLIRNLRGLENA